MMSDPISAWERAGEFVAFDIETTGLFPDVDRVVEIGAVRFDIQGRELGRFEQLVNPERPMSPSAEAIHGLGDEDLADAPTIAEVLPRFLAFLQHPFFSETTSPNATDEPPSSFVAHNARFDAGFLGSACVRLGWEIPTVAVIDTLDLARRHYPEAPDHKLATLAKSLGMADGPEHRALADSLRVMRLVLDLRHRRVQAKEAGRPLPRPSAYPWHDGGAETPPPIGWEALNRAIIEVRTVTIRYRGGSHGDQPRAISPLRFVHRGGTPYVVGHCHLGGFEKAFRLDRIDSYDVHDAADLVARS